MPTTALPESLALPPESPPSVEQVAVQTEAFAEPVVEAATDTPAAASPTPQTPATPAPPELTPAECAQRLKGLFPALFSGAPKPLKLRIQTDIQQRAPGQFTRRVLSAFLHRHTGSTGYLLAITRLGQRFDLDGVAVEPISDEHREAAQAELARRRGNQDTRRALEDEQRALLQTQRHNRVGLLRDHETTTLTRANFCVLKAVDPAELDDLLALARREAEEEAAQRPAAFERPQRPPPRRGNRPQSGQR